ncbi:uncharacterized protein HD556DRAFT_1436335 [Suillus plorans]|uniref:Uncharacterized protein n=1 Tax=Suillus plorans TaxID=116603 RepID=A0A9P7J7B7_9AGAM|nr:uncharacterized protein HD556DRAFT_1436335 [Suillus plorans]KAG1806362.1 hypothetical protein HD556DRAFT_1436335 [Suillus plorans]
MAPRSKFTTEQVEMMEEYREKYLECQTVGDYTPFWAPFFEDYHARLPEREHLFPDVPLDIDLTLEQRVVNASMVDACKKQLIHRFHNTYGNYTAKRKLKAQTTSTVEKMLASQLSLKGMCTLQPAEAYSKLYYKTRIKPVEDAKMKVLKQEAGLSPMTSDEEDDETGADRGDVKQVSLKKLRLTLVKKHTRALFANETPEIKAEVVDFVKQWSENCKKSSSEDDDISFSENIEKLPNVLADIFAGLAKQTGWAFSVLMGGPSPGMGGKIQVESFHVEQTTMGNTFNLAYPNFNERIMKPYADFAKRAFSDVVMKGTMGSPSSSPSTLDTSLLPLSQMISFDDQQCDFATPGPESLSEILANSSSSLELYDSTTLDHPVIPTSSVSLHPFMTPAVSLASETPPALPMSVAPAVGLVSKTLPVSPAFVAQTEDLMSETPAVPPASVVPMEHLVFKMPVVPPASMGPGEHIVSETPALPSTFMVPAEDLASETSALPIVKLVCPTSTSPALPVIKPVHPASPSPAVPFVEPSLPLMHLAPVLPIVQPPPTHVMQPVELSVGPPAEPIPSKAVVEGPQESTHNEVANSIGSVNIGKEKSASKKRPKSLTHGAPAKKQHV